MGHLTASGLAPGQTPASSSSPAPVALPQPHPSQSNPQVSLAVSDHSQSSPSRFTNRLAREKSPYLLQHAHNPVDWYPWGEEAFAKARRENKPIFLSIGYSTCHWCHVMERESFEKEDVAKVLNSHFVSIKVDREERPDVDKIYMTFVQATTGGGGWPLNVFLTPDLKPFFGGTYWPPESRRGQPGFVQVLEMIEQAWRDKRDQIVANSEELYGKLDAFAKRAAPDQVELTANVLREAGLQLKSGYDAVNGGFGNAPKFPTPSYVSFLLHYGVRFQDDEAVRMVTHTCQAMAAGGIYDQLGGGFSRYSVDAKWLVPHFEKMLYDNAQLVELYLNAYQTSGDKKLAAVARDILRYVLRDMTHPEGGFYSAEDADSEGHEGKFYCWTKKQMAEALTPKEFEVAARYFGVTDDGNFLDHSHPEPLPNQNVLHVADSKLSPEEKDLLESARTKLFQIRSKRIRPHLDDKILASWNGLMLGAMARASVVLDDPTYRAAAEKNLAFLQSKLWDPASKTLYHRWRDGQRDSTQLQESYAFLLGGVLDLYEATLRPAHLEFALELAESMIERFYDREQGGFWQSPEATKDLILRVKEDYDGAEPSGNSVAILSLLRLSALTGREDFKATAEKTLNLFGERLRTMPQAAPYMLLSLDYDLESPKRLVLAGDPQSELGRKLLLAAHSVYQRNKVVLGTAGPVEPFARTLTMKDEKATAYLCTGTACLPPTHDPAKVKQLLSK
jgi:uncharacterized protein